MTPLGERLVRLIAASGPIGVGDFMAACLFDPQHGYYTTREPFGREGDFVTAPEVSQMFGELVAVRLLQAWQAAGNPLPATIAEIGPGRGTLMKDIVRTLRRLAPDLASAADFALVEASPRLAAVQEETLRGSGPAYAWHATVDTLPRRPLFIAGNEIFDALPFRQFVRTDQGWVERAVGIGEDGAFRFVLGTSALPLDALPQKLRDAANGSIFEIAPAREALMSKIAEHIAMHGGAGIFFDYGHLAPSAGTRSRPSAGTAARMSSPIRARPTSPRMWTSPRWRRSPARTAWLSRQRRRANSSSPWVCSNAPEVSAGRPTTAAAR